MKTRVKVSSIFWFSVLYVCDGIYVMGMMKGRKGITAHRTGQGGQGKVKQSVK